MVQIHSPLLNLFRTYFIQSFVYTEILMNGFVDFIKHRNLIVRILFIILISIPFIFYNDFSLHIYSHFTGTILPHLITEQWHIVLMNILVFVTFLLPLSFRRKIDWKEYGLVTAFFVSLFIEMYGLPLTVFFVSKAANPSNIGLAPIVFSFDFFGIGIAMTLAMLYGLILMTIGTILIMVAWITLYKKIKTTDLVTTGIYSYSRHPQYLGFILVIFGWLIGWPTFLTVIFALILVYKYVKVCKVEEKELFHIEKYKEYKEKAPFFI